jgi:Ca-activated chloride channel family protein
VAQDADYIADALRRNHINLDIAPLPQNAQGFLSYDCVILANVSARFLLPAQEAALASWVKDFGGGLVMVGGDDSFGPGGYAETPLEDIAPVDMDVKRRKHLASLALAVMIDKSGSMGAPAGGGVNLRKMDLANQGAWETAHLLDSTDEANVGAVDTEVKWMLDPSGNRTLFPMTAANKATLKTNTLSNEYGGGGIYCKTALAHAYDAVTAPDVTAMSRHVILFADTSDSEEPENCIAMAKHYYARSPSVTTSVIGMGTPRDSDYQFQKDLAAAGHGRFYITDNVMDLPKFFAKEAFIASRNAFVESKPGFTPTMYDSPLLQGIYKAGVPKLYGYVGTTLKPKAAIAMHGVQADDPVLADWSIGLGKCVAFTSDGSNRWSRDWTEWAGYPQFWGQIVKWVSRSVQNSPISTTTTFDGNTGHVIVEAANGDAQPLDNLNLHARVVPPDFNQEAHDVPLTQVGPGRYEGTFSGNEKGSYIVNVVDRNNGPVDVSGAVLNYNAEFRDLTPNVGMMKTLAQMTGGLSLTNLDGIFQTKPTQVTTSYDLWEKLLMAAAALLLIDVAMRRINWGELFRRKQSAMLAPLTSGAAVGALKSIRSGSAAVESQRETLREKRVVSPSLPSPEGARDSLAAKPLVESSGAQAKAAEESAVPAQGGGYAGRLLSAKRRAEAQIKDQSGPNS